jgi:membrane associated rhomboid family serine protease
MIPVGNDNAGRASAPATTALILICVAVFLRELLLPPGETEQFLTRWGLIPARLWTPETLFDTPRLWLRRALLPVFTSMFLHGGFLHLLGNTWSLWLFGRTLETRLGTWRYLWFYLTCGFSAGLLHAALHAHSTLPTIGASGAIAGVMGAYFLLFPFHWITFVIPVFFIPVFIKLPAVCYLLFWIVTQVAGGFQTLANGNPAAGGIAFWAHVGGFASGMLLGRRLRPRRTGRRPGRA